MSDPLRIDIVSDTVCPWCYVGKRHLEAAMAQRPDVTFDCHWQPFQLNPSMPMEGVDRETHWKQKFGDSDRIQGMVDRLREVGDALEIPFAFGEIKRQPNTLKGHALLHALDGHWQQQNALKEALLRAFFVDARDIGDEQTLIELAEAGNIDEATAKEVLGDATLIHRVRALDQQARQIGISGVPTFIFDQKTGMSGAQPVEALLEMIDQLRPEQSPSVCPVRLTAPKAPVELASQGFSSRWPLDWPRLAARRPLTLSAVLAAQPVTSRPSKHGVSPITSPPCSARHPTPC